MPHLMLECSDNLRERCDLAEVVRVVHEAALETGIFPIGGTRTRLIEYAAGRYRIADGDPASAFLAITVRIGQGRDLETKRRVGQAIFDAVCRALDEAYRTSPLAISLEVQEIDGELNFRHNNLHEYAKRRESG
jgi:5-carboxymethyl-2-hydroxymuconate isomerase